MLPGTFDNYRRNPAPLLYAVIIIFALLLVLVAMTGPADAKIIKIRHPDGTVEFKTAKDEEPDAASPKTQPADGSPSRTEGFRPSEASPATTPGTGTPGPSGSAGSGTHQDRNLSGGAKYPSGPTSNRPVPSGKKTADSVPPIAAESKAPEADVGGSGYELVLGILLGVAVLIAGGAVYAANHFRTKQTRQSAEFSDRLADVSSKAGATAAKAVEEMTQVEEMAKEREIRDLAVRAKFLELATAPGPDKSVDALFFILKNICGAAGCAVYIRDRSYDNLFIWKHSGMDPEKAGRTVLNISEISLMNLSVVRSKPLSMLDALKDPSVERTANVSHYPCVFAAPLMAGTEARGCIAVESLAMPDAHVTEETVDVMTTAAGILGPVLAGFGIFDMPKERLFLPGDDWKIEAAQKADDPISSLRGAVSPTIEEQLEKYPDLIRHSLGSRKLSYLVCRLSNYHHLWKTMAPEDFIKMMDSVQEALREVFFRFDGTVDVSNAEYMRAFWGAPIRQKNHAHQAVQAALRIYSVAKRLSGDPDAEIPRLEIDVAVATSEMRSVMSGTEGRKVYTAHGDAPGVATAMLRWSGGVAPIIDTETSELVSDEIDFDPLGGVELGDFKSRNIFKVIGLKGR